MTLLLGADEIDLRRLAIIAAVAIGAHIAVMLVRTISQWLIGTSLGSISKAQTLMRFFASTVMFLLWIIAVGFALHELKIPIQTYIASATIIGLAVSFGSQSLVQDVIGGLTLIIGGLLDVGDMVEIGGQTGVVETIGIRYTELRNVQGAVVSIPNRNVANVIGFPKGYIHAFMDVRLPEDGPAGEEAMKHLERIAESAASQFSGIMIRQPTITRMREEQRSEVRSQRSEAGAGTEALTSDLRPLTSAYLRIKFRIWPGQGGVIESVIRQRVIQRMRSIDSSYQDWMVAVHYRVEPAFTRRAVSALEVFRKRRAKKAEA